MLGACVHTKCKQRILSYTFYRPHLVHCAWDRIKYVPVLYNKVRIQSAVSSPAIGESIEIRISHLRTI